MDRQMAASLDQWLTTEPEDDDTDLCSDINGYPEHDFGPTGQCRCCDAEPDDEEENE